jgi:hypothetical protein
MTHTLPSLSDVHYKLRSLNHPGIRALAVESRVPECTLLNIRYSSGATNPRYETVAAIWPHLDPMIATPCFQSREYAAAQSAQSAQSAQTAEAVAA